ncbi:tricarballylate dehydrogenase [Malaciobacter molluscorum LMG 25693]|uniref:Tricarballylate dehydrogenase n=1 Tax=Malaciobacter molluscorum LMG 25693 TaxID=870501 RepID=A0A2G1DLL2_9BACT|nr:FAD-dependent tricarballylate dehydrogenase TcuA [Malaciobacter molluscorum]AXX92163.1 tricarballylate dehydrogenase TcuA [Malaciobacter molluscorum LMG 25693]PHO19392.1 tricarballylate dehydrogenase [Malaciobacter molluscorum LMG 25693]
MKKVIVIGGGNAALCAAITAAQNGAKVTILESAPKELRGGNSQHTRNMRTYHPEPTKTLVENYPFEEYYEDLLKVTKGETNQELATLAIKNSVDLYHWMESLGINFQPSLKGTLSLSRTNAFFLGGGKTLVNREYQIANDLGVEVLYEHEVLNVKLNNNIVEYLEVKLPNSQIKKFKADAYIAASGGFESNRDWLRQAWGEQSKNYLIRGTKFNQGKVLKSLLTQGVKKVGKEEQGHAVAVDGRAPLYDGGIVTRLDCVPFGIVLNEKGNRFYDEGEDFWPKRYAIWGRLVASQPNQVGHVIIDSKSFDLFMPSVFEPTKADTLEELAKKLNLPVEQVTKTINEFNAAVVDGEFDLTKLDNCKTEGLEVNKTHWARRIDTPPYYGYTLRPGVTFTYLGVKIDKDARVYMEDGKPMTNLFATGEMVAGNILSQGYLAGIGMTIGGVFGRIAGKGAANV